MQPSIIFPEFPKEVRPIIATRLLASHEIVDLKLIHMMGPLYDLGHPED